MAQSQLALETERMVRSTSAEVVEIMKIIDGPLKLIDLGQASKLIQGTYQGFFREGGGAPFNYYPA